MRVHTHRQRSQELEDKLNVLRWDERKLEALQQDLQQRKAEATHLLVRLLLTLARILTLSSFHGHAAGFEE